MTLEYKTPIADTFDRVLTDAGFPEDVTTLSSASERQSVASAVVTGAGRSLTLFRLLWAFGVDVQGVSPAGELIVDREILSALPTRALKVVLPRLATMAALYRFIQTLRDQQLDRTTRAVPAEWWVGVHPERVYPACCRQMTWEWMLHHDIPDATFVDARVEHPREWLALPVPVTGRQCWLELPGGLVYSGMLQRFYPIDVWRAALQPSDERRESATQERAKVFLVIIYEALWRWTKGRPLLPMPDLDSLVPDAGAHLFYDEVVARRLNNTINALVRRDAA